MDALLFAIALEVVLLQMRIHEGCSERRLSKEVLDKKGQTQYEKLVRDREMVKDVVRRTLIEVAENGGWSTLQRAVEMLQVRIFLSVAKRKEHEELKRSLEDTSKELTAKRNEWVVKLRNADHKIALLRDKIQDNLLNTNIRLSYAELWLNARLEAQELHFMNEMKTGLLPNAEHEQRVHQEIYKALELQIQEHEDAVAKWKARYTADIASISECLAQQRWQLGVASGKREELQKLYDLHEGEMRAWRSFKEQRAARLAREQRIRDSAVLIQSWWRGTLVRKALGPFKYLRNLKKSPSKSKKK